MADLPPLKIPANHKFACLAISVDCLQQQIRFPVRYDGTLWVASTPPFELDGDWRRWLGLRAEKFENSNLFLVAVRPTSRPLVLNEEDAELERAVRLYFVALAIVGMPFSDSGLTIGGACPAPGPAILIRTDTDTSRMYHTHRGALNLTERHLVTGAQLAANMGGLETGEGRPRLWRGFRSLVRALESRSWDERLHGFVRSLDGITMLPQREGRKEFVRRCQLLASDPPDSGRILDELYKLRSAAEHLNALDTVPSRRVMFPPDRNALLNRRVVQAEVLARSVYSRILRSEVMVRHFACDAWIRDFWQKKDDEIRSIWGPPVSGWTDWPS